MLHAGILSGLVVSSKFALLAVTFCGFVILRF